MVKGSGEGGREEGVLVEAGIEQPEVGVGGDDGCDAAQEFADLRREGEREGAEESTSE